MQVEIESHFGQVKQVDTFTADRLSWSLDEHNNLMVRRDNTRIATFRAGVWTSIVEKPEA